MTESAQQVLKGVTHERRAQRRPLLDFRNQCRALLDRVFPTTFGRHYRKIRSHSLLSHARLKGIHDSVVRVLGEGVPGDLVECGVARGGSAALIQRTLQAAGENRTLWLFDTFEGLPEPTPEDPDYEVALKSVGKCRGELDEVKELLQQHGGLEGIEFRKGLFQDTLPLGTPKQIAFLHLDGDWYDSTRVCLEALYDAVSPGGILQIDDYGHWAGARKAVDEFCAARGLSPRLEYLDYTGRTWIK